MDLQLRGSWIGLPRVEMVGMGRLSPKRIWREFSNDGDANCTMIREWGPDGSDVGCGGAIGVVVRWDFVEIQLCNSSLKALCEVLGG